MSSILRANREGMDALDALAPVVQTDCETDDYDS